jgi:carbamoyltransferase
VIILGVNETSHDASVSLIKDGEVLFAAHAERYSKKKNDWYNNNDIILDALNYGTPNAIAYYENPILKKSRMIIHGGASDWKPRIPMNVPVHYFKHHYSHAAAGYYTSSFTDAVVVVLDAIGEYNTSTIWVGENEKIKLKYKQNYPVSFGLFYSAFTQLLGLMPNQEEYIMMGMAAYGNPDRYFNQVNEYFPSYRKQKYNFHKGIHDFAWGTVPCFSGLEGTGYAGDWIDQRRFDLAAAVQKVYELRLIEFMRYAKKITNKNNLVFMGGCALNSKANTLLWGVFKDVWIMPNPGDAGSSLGAAAALYGKHLNWKGPYLGHDIGGDYPIDKILKKLITDKVAAVATGRAEYGPRALGNRSILADPRDPNIKNIVNSIKKREDFRPFAPVVLEEHASQWFDMDYTSPYMQFTPSCIRPEIIPSVVHKDGTSRVQTVNISQNKGLYLLLLKWYDMTGVPVLLNTSLNIKGQPLVNDLQDVKKWEENYNHSVIT